MVLLLTPPTVQLNAAYPATPVLTAFLRQKGVEAVQDDFSIRTAVELLGKDDPAIKFLQSDRTAWSGAKKLPRGPRFDVLEQMSAVGIEEGIDDIFLASLYVDDLADDLARRIPEFGLSRYAEKIAVSASSFGPLRKKLAAEPSEADVVIRRLTDAALQKHKPDFVGITVPFPGCLYGALRIAQRIREKRPECRIIFGGGYVSTELRSLSDLRIFDFIDYLVFDDGEVPLLNIVTGGPLLRTLTRTSAPVMTHGELRHADRPAPDYSGLPLKLYLRMAETVNPMFRLWSEKRWNKITLAHGCYWHKCAFCDTTLDYICRYDPAGAERVAEWIETVLRQTGEPYFHFTDEAAPPALLERLARILIDRKIRIKWWGNVRFEKAFTPELCSLLAESGCIAVTGGAECASDDVLKKMNKGVTQKQIQSAVKAFSEAGIMAHLYLMYGFPGQKRRQVLDGLDFVRRLFKAGYVQSAYWHRFALTIHSPLYPEIGLPVKGRFARNEASWRIPASMGDQDQIGQGLRRAVYNYMHGIGLSEDIRAWF